MSGGSMEYVFSRIGYAAEEVATEIEKMKKVALDEMWISPYYKKNYPDCDWINDPAKLKERVLKHMQDALDTLRRAEVYARRVEWMTSGDDGYESFVLRTEEELAELEKKGEDKNED